MPDSNMPPSARMHELMAWMSMQVHHGLPLFAVTIDTHGLSQTGDPDKAILGLQVSVQYPAGCLFITDEEKEHVKTLLNPVMDYIEARIKQMMKKLEEDSE